MKPMGHRDLLIIQLRTGYHSGNGQPMTLDQIGNLLGLSKERVRQVLATALKKLRFQVTGLPNGQ